MNQQRTVRNLLVTGGAGFIGSAFIRYLLHPDRQFCGTCVNLDLLTYAGNLQNLRDIEDSRQYIFQQGDIGNEKLVSHLLEEYDIDTVIHFAAESHVDRSILGPEAFIQTNILGTFRLLEAIRKHPSIHFHHVSTDEVYGSFKEGTYASEQSPYQPNSPYSASKAASDHLVRAYHHTYGLSTCLSHCGNNFGPYQFPEKFIPLMILNCLTNQPLPIYGTGENVRDWIYVGDHVEALWLLLQCGLPGHSYGIGGDAEMRNLDVVQEIIHLLSHILSVDPETYQQQITFVKDRPGHDQRYALDSSKIRNQLGWKPKHDFSQALEETIRWYHAHGDWVESVRDGSYQKWIELNYLHRG